MIVTGPHRMAHRVILVAAFWLTTVGHGQSHSGETSSRKPSDKAISSSSPVPSFEAIDQNRDGMIDSSEFDSRNGASLREIDRNGDQKISRVEFGLWIASRKSSGASKLSDSRDQPASRTMEEMQATASNRPSFGQLDRNGDGKITSDEIPAGRGAMLLKNIDRDRDGAIDEKEFNLVQRREGFTGRLMERMSADQMTTLLFRQKDNDSNGTLEPAEVDERMKTRFGLIDTNSDGHLSKAEVSAMINRMREYSRQTGPGSASNASPRQLFYQQDMNADGRVSREESKDSFRQNFNRLDVNGDEELDLREVENGIVLDDQPQAKTPTAKTK